MIKLKSIKKKPSKDMMILMIAAGLLLLIISIPSDKVGDLFSGDSEETAQTNVINSSVQVEEAISNAEQSFDMIQDSSKITAGKGGDTSDTGDSYREELETRLEELISCMDGVESARVMVMINSGNEMIVEKDVVFETGRTMDPNAKEGDGYLSGDSAEQKETVFLVDAEGNSLPYVRKVNYPKVDGVVVVIECKSMAGINVSVTECIQALFGIEAHKIKIVKMKS